jgi:hypothetical protein
MIDFIEKGASVLIEDFTLTPMPPSWEVRPKGHKPIAKRVMR